MTPKQNKTIHRVISVFGEKNQQMQTLEELMELQHAVFEHVHRGTDNRDNIVEEIADVEIMIAQLKQIHNIQPNEIEQIKERKLNRLEHTIDKYLQKQNNSKTSNEKNGSINTDVVIDRITSNGR